MYIYAHVCHYDSSDLNVIERVRRTHTRNVRARVPRVHSYILVFIYTRVVEYKEALRGTEAAAAATTTTMVTASKHTRDAVVGQGWGRREKENGRVKKGKKEEEGKGEREGRRTAMYSLYSWWRAVYIPNLGHTGTDAISAPLSLVRSQSGGENESWNSKQGGPRRIVRSQRQISSIIRGL